MALPARILPANLRQVGKSCEKNAGEAARSAAGRPVPTLVLPYCSRLHLTA
jgi:hypothetical protein